LEEEEAEVKVEDEEKVEEAGVELRRACELICSRKPMRVKLLLMPATPFDGNTKASRQTGQMIWFSRLMPAKHEAQTVCWQVRTLGVRSDGGSFIGSRQTGH